MDPGPCIPAVELDFILKMDESIAKALWFCPFITVILMAVGVGWVLRVKTV